MAVICGTPTPATTRVVQIEPGPMPTFSACPPAPLAALARVRRDADRGAGSPAAALVLRRVRILDPLLDVLDGDEPAETAVGVDDGQLLDLVPVEDLLRLGERRAHRCGDKTARRHQRRHRLID